jgi:probable addiction module antidote protein
MPRTYRSYDESLNEALKDPGEAAGYLSACLEGGSREVFLLGLRQVAAAHGVSRVAEGSRLGRESLYRALSQKGNPKLDTLLRVLDTAGLKLAVIPKGPKRRAA